MRNRPGIHIGRLEPLPRQMRVDLVAGLDRNECSQWISDGIAANSVGSVLQETAEDRVAHSPASISALTMAASCLAVGSLPFSSPGSFDWS